MAAHSRGSSRLLRPPGPRCLLGAHHGMNAVERTERGHPGQGEVSHRRAGPGPWSGWIWAAPAEKSWLPATGGAGVDEVLDAGRRAEART